MSDESKTPEPDAPPHPSLIVPLTSAEPAPTNGHQAKLVEAAELGLVYLPASLRQLKEIGDSVDLIGMAGIMKGSVAVSLDECRKIEKNCAKAIQETDDPIEKAALINAYATLIKCKTGAFKAIAETSGVNPRDRKARRSFGKGEKIGPIDIKPES